MKHCYCPQSVAPCLLPLVDPSNFTDYWGTLVELNPFPQLPRNQEHEMSQGTEEGIIIEYFCVSEMPHLFVRLCLPSFRWKSMSAYFTSGDQKRQEKGRNERQRCLSLWNISVETLFWNLNILILGPVHSPPEGIKSILSEMVNVFFVKLSLIEQFLVNRKTYIFHHFYLRWVSVTRLKSVAFPC